MLIMLIMSMLMCENELKTRDNTGTAEPRCALEQLFLKI